MPRVLLVTLIFGLTIYSLIDCARADESQIKNLPKWGWLLIIIFLGPQALAIGPVAYLIAGRMSKPKLGGPKPKRRILPPDDDPDFLGKL
jgi:Phospholipase_D-nuclease N-terminal